jgi:hypothetical protein
VRNQVHRTVAWRKIKSSKPHGGAFDLLRLLAALSVLVAHSYDLCGFDSHDPLIRITHRGVGADAGSGQAGPRRWD